MISAKARDGETPIMDWMTELAHEPWVGPDFYMCPLKVYLGDSHCDEMKCPADITHAVILDHGDDSVRLRFLTRCMSQLAGLPEYRIDRQRFWNSIAFCNLSTSETTATPRAADENSYIYSAAAFSAVVDIIRPDFIVTLGDRVWSALETTGVMVDGRQTPQYWCGEIAHFPVFHSAHPSGAFSSTRWSKKSSQFLKDLRIEKGTIQSFVERVKYSPRSELLAAFEGEP